MSTPNAGENTDGKDLLLLVEGDFSSPRSRDPPDRGSDPPSEKGESRPADRVTTREQEPGLDPRFHPPTPSPFKRAALVLFTILLFWLALSMRTLLWEEKKAPHVVYASRYSKEHKFRPAASPIITETLKDGRVRIRGAGPTIAPLPKPTRKTARAGAKQKKRKTGKNTRKRSSSKE